MGGGSRDAQKELGRRPRAPERAARELLRSHPAIYPEETRDPVTHEGPETFSFVPRSPRTTRHEPRSLVVCHDSIVVVCRSIIALRR
jgi:hypothetical protein